MRRLMIALLSVVAALAVAGCGEREESLGPQGQRSLDLMLDWIPNPDHAGIYSADGRGFFKTVGLDVNIRRPADPSAPIKQVAAGRVDLAISYEPEVMRARAAGQKVVAVAAIVPVPLASVISLPPDDVPDAGALRGKKIGVTGIEYQDAFLDEMLERANIDSGDVERVRVGFDLQKALLTKKVDVTLGGFKNVEVVELQLKRRRPTHFTVDEAGIPPYNELVLVTSETTLNEKRDEIRSFIGALARGTRLAQREPEVAAGFLSRANRELDPKLQLEGTKKTPFAQPAGKPFGYQDPEQWKRFAEFMTTSGAVEGDLNVDETFTNDLLPGGGVE